MPDLIEKLKALKELGATRIEVKPDGSIVVEFGPREQPAPVFVPVLHPPVFVPYVQPQPFAPHWWVEIICREPEPVDITHTFTCRMGALNA